MAVGDHVIDVFKRSVEYVDALDALEGADSREFAEHQQRVQVTLHDLGLAVRGHCAMCDPGSCPGLLG